MNQFLVLLRPDGSIRFCYKAVEPVEKHPFIVGIQGDSSKGEYVKVTDAESLTGYEITFQEVTAVEDPDSVIVPEPLPEPPPVPEDPPCPPCDPCPVCPTCPKCGGPLDRCSKCDPCPPCPDPDPCPPCEPCPTCPKCGKPFSVCRDCDPCPPCPDPDPCPPCEPEIKVVEKIIEVPVDRPVWGPWYWIKILWNKVF